MYSNQELNILIVGASGNLGSLITREALKHTDLKVNIMLRNISKSKDLAEMVKNAGGKVFEGDVNKPETIKDITKGMHTVISVLIGGEDVILDGQTRLLEDAEKNGVKRFVPSDFSFDIWGIPQGQYYFTDLRLKFKQRLDKSKVKGLHFSIGMFMQTYLWNIQKEGIQYLGDINQKIDLTTEEDTAKFTIAAVRDKNRIGHVKIFGQELSTKEIVDIYNMVLDKHEIATNQGSLEEVRNMLPQLKEQGKLFELVQMSYAMIMMDGSGKIKERMNSQFPEVKETSFEEFLKTRQGKQVYEFTYPGVVKACEKQILKSG